MRPVLLVVGAIILLMGVAYALQGAHILPATFMRGPEWIAIGAAVAGFGVAIVFLGTRRAAKARNP